MKNFMLNLIKNMDRNKKKEQQWLSTLYDSVLGCIFGGAYGDALGYPVEFMKLYQIEDEYGEEGITELRLKNGKAQISDDTQMSLYTGNALLLWETDKTKMYVDGTLESYVFKSYQEWYKSQIGIKMQKCSCWISNRESMRDSRAPGNTCLAAIATSNGKGSADNPINDSKGCGGVMRIAPIACYAVSRNIDDKLFSTINAAKVAALTHTHPLGYITAAYLAGLIHEIIRRKISGGPLVLLEICKSEMEEIRKIYGSKQHYKEFEDIILKAIELTRTDRNDIFNINELGEGWVAEEALAIGVYSAIKYQDNFNKCISVAVNHNGDSDSTGAIAGNIIGALIGLYGIDNTGDIITSIESYDVIYEIAQDIVSGCQINETNELLDVKWRAKYITGIYGS